MGMGMGLPCWRPVLMIGCACGGNDAESRTGVCGGVGGVGDVVGVEVEIAFAPTVCAGQHQQCSGGVCGFFLVSGPFHVHFSDCVCGLLGRVHIEILVGAGV